MSLTADKTIRSCSRVRFAVDLGSQTPMVMIHCSHSRYLNGAGDEGRTRDNQLGKLELYQLSYTRLCGLHYLIPLHKLTILHRLAVTLLYRRSGTISWSWKYRKIALGNEFGIRPHKLQVYFTIFAKKVYLQLAHRRCKVVSEAISVVSVLMCLTHFITKERQYGKCFS